MASTETQESIEKIAIIGMAGQFPGAKNIEHFWQNLKDGVESISRFSEEELISAGVEPTLLNESNYVKAGGVLDDIDLFDAAFFELNHKEAEITDPQHRLFLESAWEALENAGYDSQRCNNRIGVYAGASLSNYCSFDFNSDHVGSATSYQTLIGNDKDFLSTRVSYKLNLKGPSITVQTACSSSLVAVSLACQSLLNYQCDMALAGGVSIHTPQKTGYISQEGGTLSPDGHCYAFDARAKGTVIGNGVGVVVLKRLQDAIADGDFIYATILGSAINNDGSGKVGYTAPSVDGQAEAIAEAMMLADVEPETISYIETHGTGTALGDPIEIAALSQVFRSTTDKTGFCAIGSVKTNIGHLDAAAGVTGLIKTALALKHQLIPPSLNFEQPNPQIDFASSPFYVNTKLSEWQTGANPRRAGVSSLGMGGTNAHVILEEREQESRDAGAQGRNYQLLVLSAKTDSALETATKNLAQYLTQHPDLKLADVAYTLQVGRKEFNYRRILVCEDIEDAIKTLSQQDTQRVLTHFQEPCQESIAFMFPGQGAQYANMGKELYETETVFREQVDRCCEILKLHLDLDLRTLIYPQNCEVAIEQLKQTHIAQPALFIIEYALAQLWMSWGVRPQAAIGHSIGEYVAACLAGVFSLEDALVLVAARGRLMQQMPAGSMLAVSLPQEQVQALLNEELSIAASNAPSACVVAGSHDAINTLKQKLLEKGINCRRLHVSHAFHSSMMESILEPFRQEVTKVKLHPPKMPFISNITGTWITNQEATDPNYWVKHLRQIVYFSPGISELVQEANRIFLEVGPGQTLCTLSKQHSSDKLIISSLAHPQEKQSDVVFLLNNLGRLWLSGVSINWSGFYANERRQRIPLPTYSFERQRYWHSQQSSVEQSRRGLKLPDFWQSLIEAGQVQSVRGIFSFDQKTYAANKNRLEDLCSAYMNLALQDLGIFSNTSEKYSLDELLVKGRILPYYRQLLCRWLTVLVERGYLQQDAGRFSNLLPIFKTEVNNLVAQIKTKWTDTQQAIELIQNYGDNLAALLIGEKEPLELHFATLVKDGKIARENSPADIYYNSITKATVEQLVRSLPVETNLRFLEIGGGTGIATAELLPLLPSHRTKYTFTDVGGFFLDEAKKKFNAYPFIEYRFLDIEKSLTEQGYTPHSFDIVIAVNVFHVTQNLGKTIDSVLSLLAPGGFLLIQEITQPQLEFDITDGLLMPPLEDEKRSQGNPFLSKQKWQEILRAHGFVRIANFSETEAFGQHIFLAQASLSATESKDGKLDIADWFYIPLWQRSLPPHAQLINDEKQENWLIFVDNCGLGDRIVQRLKLQGQNIITVRLGEEFASTENQGDRSYIINPRHRSNYTRLIEELRTRNFRPTKIVHLWSVTPVNETELTSADVQAAQERGFYSLLFLTKGLGAENNSNQLQIKVISNNMQAVSPDEILCPQKATIVGLVKVIGQEYQNIHCCSIDINLPTSGSWQEEKLTEKLLIELTAPSSDHIVAYRGGYRWVRTFKKEHLPAITKKPKLKTKGVYLIVGGLGSLGLVLAEYLAKNFQAKLILTGHSNFPQPDQWPQWLMKDDATSSKIRKLLELESLGAEVIVVQADTANLEQMQQVIAKAETKFGAINGVIHSVATSLTQRMRQIEQITEEECDREFQGKVYGLLVLQQVLQRKKLEFCFLVSSLASIFGGVGHSAYSASNLFMDAFVAQHNQINSIPWVSLNWDGRVPFLEAKNESISFLNPELTMTPEDDVEVFNRVLPWDELGQVVVSTRNLEIRIKEWANFASIEQKNNSSSRHFRSNLNNTYSAPRNLIEQEIVNLWQELLGVQKVGIHDNFFKLGGDSLTGVTLINKFQQKLSKTIPIAALFEAPTVAELAEYCQKQSPIPVLLNDENHLETSDREQGVL
ncbi:type I polyketide synthase [uncultured Nostoc sp.]|uniref:type I polyketide synthase n=1 Tax=uncultured Nostoc sp. TaxID=340711 RepID=UPI00262F2593|nr:type I polyketide synthase [uncultured Nostoc sp.]